MTPFVFSLITSYLVGSIPFSLIAGKVLKGIDIRNYGSGNLGATNVFRNIGPLWGAIVLLLDIGKGATAILLTNLIFSSTTDPFMNLDLIKLLSGATAVLGHTASPFVKFNGGKGVATSAGIFLVLSTYPILISLGVFSAVMITTRIVSLSSIAAASVFPFVVFFFELRSADGFSWSIFAFTALLSFFIIFKHRSNIKRLKDGDESTLNTPQKEGKSE